MHKKLKYESDEGIALRSQLGSGDPTNFKLAVVFPISACETASAHYKYAAMARMWLAFFSFYGFRPPGPDWPNSLDDKVLVWDANVY